MPDKRFYKDYEYEGSLAKVCKSFVAEKRAIGIYFNSEAQQLYALSRFCANYDLPADTLTEEAVKGWLTRRPNDADKTVAHRFSIIKGLAEYMQRMGYSTYCPSRGDIPKLQLGTYIPHIFTHKEVSAFFDALDASGKTSSAYSLRRQNMMSQIFRLLYCCGLRTSEVKGLTIGDVNWDESLLLIRDSKFDKSRYIPMSAEMAESLKTYVNNNVHTPYLFPDRYGEMFGDKAIYIKFREVLLLAGIPHKGLGIGPRVHDFRHTFSVHCLQKWIAQGRELTTVLPRLSAYLGHTGLGSTEKYLRMTAEVFPEITDNLSRRYGHLIPKEVFIHETN
jgi:integrase